MGFPPEAYLIGAMKAGTTTLAFLLDQHPRITLSQPKEPDFFTRNWSRGLDWYRGVFTGPPDAILLDASTSYAMAPADDAPARWRSPDNPLAGVPRRIHSVNPHSRFIYAMRDPVARTYSHYWHAVRQGEEPLEFRAAIAKPDRFYLRLGDYESQLRKYLEFFPLESFLFVVFEDLVRDPVGVSRRCFEFLGVGPHEVLVDAPAARKNVSFRYTGPAGVMARWLPAAGWKALVGTARAIVPDRLRPVLARAVARDIPPMAAADRQFLADYFRPRNDRLRKLVGLPLTTWQS